VNAAAVDLKPIIRDFASAAMALLLAGILAVVIYAVLVGIFAVGAALVGPYKAALALGFLLKGIAPLLVGGLLGWFVRHEIRHPHPYYRGMARAIAVSSVLAVSLAALGAHDIFDIAIDVREPVRQIDVTVTSVSRGRYGTTLRTDRGDFGFPAGTTGRVTTGPYTLGLAAQTREILFYRQR
jgi:hypothetical protein